MRSLLTREDDHRNMRIRPEWSMLRGTERRAAIFGLILFVASFGTFIGARRLRFIDSEKLRWRDVAPLPVILSAFGLFLWSAARLSPGRPARRYSGRCFGCGKARPEFAQVCIHCGAELALQDAHVRACKHRLSVENRFGKLDRAIAFHCGAALLIEIPIAAAYGWWCHHMIASWIDRPWFRASLVGMFVLGFLLLTAPILVMRPRLRNALERLRGCCIYCGIVLPVNHELVDFCPTCNASLVVHRNRIAITASFPCAAPSAPAPAPDRPSRSPKAST